MKVPDLEVDRQAPLGHEGVVGRVGPQTLDTSLRPTLSLKLLQEVYAHCVLLQTTIISNTKLCN